jgi:hypothetical protein
MVEQLLLGPLARKWPGWQNTTNLNRTCRTPSDTPPKTRMDSAFIRFAFTSAPSYQSS